MVSERIQRRIDALLEEADAAAERRDWPAVIDAAQRALALDSESVDAKAYLEMASLDTPAGAGSGYSSQPEPAGKPPTPALPASFVSGRYRVLRLLGEGGRKRVYLAHDQRLDRDVAFAVIKTEGLDAMGRERVQREARAMARIGSHPNLVAIHDIGEEGGDAFFVQEYMDGGDLSAAGRQPSPGSEGGLSIERVLEVGKDIARGLAFMHRTGVVHRDLKPANVFLANDGTAKVGDFGLAMAADLTRITQHGTLVGTVAYMPPEQAVGGDVTARSDLYSFGALLYELVTGRPPFTGDDPTAIISQHLNTPPVAPSWHCQDCPVGLEKVILALLEKDPSKRPADASEVLSLLEKVDPGEKPAPRSDGHVLERLARGVFVGREKELERLRKAFDEAFSGRGGLVMLVGEPGIGKTRTAQEVETYARMRGAQVLWGRSHENSGAPAFWPWVQVGRSWGATNDVNTLTPFLAAGGGDLARLFPELRNVPGYVELPPLMDGGAAQFRLFDAYTGFVRTVSEQKPLIVTLDDLHWADKPTLQLLQHLGRELARMRVLVLCTYRDTDLSRTHPLSEALAELNREPGFERVVLRGLSREEVRTYIAAAANIEPAPPLVERIYEETEGNPFFLSEVVNLLTQEGTLTRESVSDIRIPDGVKEALGRRLDRLTPEANTLLQVAAVVGREFTYDTLQLLHSGDDDDLLKRIEEGLEARVIEEMAQAGRYRFTHALMQETLLGELSTTRRVRLHGQVGEALERRWGERAEEYASRLATHFSESASLAPAHAVKAFHYLQLAGAAAERQYAWAEASAYYLRCVGLYDDGLAPDVDVAPLLVRLGATGWNAGDANAVQHGQRAARIYRERGDGLGFALAVVEIADSPLLWDTPELMSLLLEALDRLPPAHPAIEGRLLGNVLIELVGHDPYGRPEEALLERAEALAREHDIPFLSSLLLHCQGMHYRVAGDFDACRRVYEQALAAADRAGAFSAAATHVRAIGWAWVGEGYLDRAYAEYERGKAYALSRHLGFEATTFHGNQAHVRFLRGEIPRGNPTFHTGGYGAAPMRMPWRVLLAELRGETELLLPGLKEVVQQSRASGFMSGWLGATSGAYACALYAAGRVSEASEALTEWADDFRKVDGWDLTYLSVLLSPGHALVELASEELVSMAYARLTALPMYRAWWYWGLDHIRGDLALRLGRVDEADRWYTVGLEWAEREHCPIELGHNLKGLAAVAERRGDVPRAIDLLNRAAGLFQETGAKRHVDRAVAKKLQLQGLSDTDPYTSIVAVSRAVEAERPELGDTSPDGTITLMFTDIENSTALTEQFGDARWMEVLRAHNAVIEREVAAHGGRVVKTIGDGYMVVFASPEAAVRCALAIQEALTPGPSPAAAGEGSRAPLGPRLSDLGTPIRVRIGLHTGSVVREGSDFFGREVNYAARVASAALGGEVLVSDAVLERCRAEVALAFGDVRQVQLKGFEGWHAVRPVFDASDYAARRAPGPRPGGLSQRESEVVRLIAGGASNQQIAGLLVISPATAARHVANILLKLNLSNRTEVAAWAHDHGLGSGSN